MKSKVSLKLLAYETKAEYRTASGSVARAACSVTFKKKLIWILLK